MNHAASVYFLSLLTCATGRLVTADVAEASLDFFPELPDFASDGKLAAAVRRIAVDLPGTEPIGRDELRAGVERFYAESGTRYCPPVIAALS